MVADAFTESGPARRKQAMTELTKRVLLVDDEEKLLKSIAQRLTVLGFVPHTATTGMRAIDIARQHPIDLAIVDLKMPDMDGLVTITKLKEIKPALKTVLLTGHGSEKVKQATESLNTLYFEKDEMREFWGFIKKLNTDGKVVVIRPSATSTQPQAGGENPPVRFAPPEIEIHSQHDFAGTDKRIDGFSNRSNRSGRMNRQRIVGETAAMQKLRKDIERVANLDCTVVLHGEPGTGKELAARAIHTGSMRRGQRFLAINCADFRKEQPAGQLLGYRNENLYEAIRTRSGIFGAGQIGTLLFDRIEEMPDTMQDQLLNILDATDSQPPDSPADIRILVATAVDLVQRVHAKSFKQNLLDRLKVFELTIPPLRERKDDIAPLCQYFLDNYRRELAKPVERIAPDVIELLTHYGFPGNVHELAHIVERAVILADGDTIERKHLPERFLKNQRPAGSLEARQFSTLADLEKRYIVEVLGASNGNKSKTAEILGISRAALWRKLKQIRAETPGQVI
jgi:two-component system response regulator AtoC